MASTYTDLGLELMATGENAGTWGTKTNANLSLIEQLTGGFKIQTLNAAGSGANTTPLAIADGALTGAAQNRVIILGAVSPEAITGNKIVTVPLLTETFYIMKNSTSGAYTVQLKAASGSGATVTWSATDKGYKIVYIDGVATNTGVYDTGFSTTVGDVTLTGTQTLTNKTLTSAKINTGLFDTNGNESILFTATGSAINEITVTNAAASGDPKISATGGDTNIDLNLVAKGTGVVQSNGVAMLVAGKQTIWVPATAMYATSSNGCADIEQTELTAGRPELKTLDFDPSSDENAQFSVAFPKAWDPSQLIMYQVFWTANSTNTGNCIWNLKGVAIANDDAIDVAFGTGIDITDAHSGTANDLNVTAQSSSVTVAGSPGADEDVFFNISRDANAGGDTFSADAKLLGIKLFFATNLPNDA
jgi:hypothetical protein